MPLKDHHLEPVPEVLKQLDEPFCAQVRLPGHEDGLKEGGIVIMHEEGLEEREASRCISEVPTSFCPKHHSRPCISTWPFPSAPVSLPPTSRQHLLQGRHSRPESGARAYQGQRRVPVRDHINRGMVHAPIRVREAWGHHKVDLYDGVRRVSGQRAGCGVWVFERGAPYLTGSLLRPMRVVSFPSLHVPAPPSP